MDEHEPEVIWFDSTPWEDEMFGVWRTQTPGEVCLGCSDPQSGIWVPVSFCPQARALLPS
jgi:hypothetical protein